MPVRPVSEEETMNRTNLVVCILALGCAMACGPSAESEPQTGADSSQPVAQTPAESAQQGMEQMMQGLQQMAQGGGQTTPVDFEVLKALLPELSGWERSDVSGQQVTTVVSVSTAEARYERGDGSMTLEIVDTSLSQVFLAPFMMVARSGFEERSDDGYTRATTLAGYPGFETWEIGTAHAEVAVLVADRFLVKAEGTGLEDPGPARALVEAVDLSTLATLKPAAAGTQ
jgi:hypothetical protein